MRAVPIAILRLLTRLLAPGFLEEPAQRVERRAAFAQVAEHTADAPDGVLPGAGAAIPADGHRAQV
ncbi:MAG TPA: hypothetical protein VI814_10830, partial [Candidatus Limnocylindria bacterium]